MNRLSLYIICGALSLAASSCSIFRRPAPVAAESTAIAETDNDRLAIGEARKAIDGEWLVYSIGNRRLSGEDRPYIHFSLADNILYGSTGCNIVNGPFAFSGKEGLTIGHLTSTLKACHNGGTEKQYLQALSDTRTYVISKIGHELYMELRDSSGKALMVLRRHNLEYLNGIWEVEEIEGRKTGLNNMRLAIDVNDMHLHGNTSCNIINGEITIDPDKNNSIQFSDISIGKTPCTEDIHKLEGTLLIALESVEYARQSRRSNRVELLDRHNTPMIMLKRATPRR